MAGSLLGKKIQRFASGKRPLRWLLWSIDGSAMLLFWGVMKLLGPDRASATGAALFRRMGPLAAKHRHVMTNLHIAFPQMTQDELLLLARNSWGNLGAVLAEYPHLGRMVTDPQRVELRIDGDSAGILANKQQAIFVFPHLGNWELSVVFVLREQAPLTIVYSPQQNPIMEWMVQYFRRPLGVRLISGKGGAARVHAELGEGHCIGMLPDQRAVAQKLFPFFGQDAQTTTAPARLALSSGSPLIPVQVERLQSAHFRVTLHKPLQVDDPDAAKHEQVRQLTQKLNDLFEQWIRARPEQWLCSKRRWPKPGKANF